MALGRRAAHIVLGKRSRLGAPNSSFLAICASRFDRRQFFCAQLHDKRMGCDFAKTTERREGRITGIFLVRL